MEQIYQNAINYIARSMNGENVDINKSLYNGKKRYVNQVKLKSII